MRNDLSLIQPTVEYEAAYTEMLADWNRTGEKKIPFVLNEDTSDFVLLVSKWRAASQGIGIPENFVPYSNFWLIDPERRILGVVNIRHYLNDTLLQQGGHIGYGIRPSERRKGYATIMLHLALAEAKKMGLERVLITCDQENTGSAKTILHNGGKLESEILIGDEWLQRYWIEL